MSKDISVLISQLLLDPENPRIAGQDSQMDIRQALLDDQGSKIVELAEDICAHGMNPMDRMMLLQPDPKKKEFIALEGNRRTAALQILYNPDLLKDLNLPDSLRNKLVDLADRFDPKSLEPLPGVLMPNREAARRWIELRHTGQNGGRGIVDWNGVQTARFRGDKMLKIIDFVKEKADLSEAERGAVDANFPITTLDRIISNPTVRQRLGVQIVDGEFYFTYPWKEVVKGLKRVVVDLATKKINVTAVKSKDQQICYIDGLPRSALPAGPKLTSPQSLNSIMTTKATPPAPPPPPPPKPLDRKTLLPKSFAVAIVNQKASQLYWELRSLNIEKFPIAGAVTLRSFVESAVAIYFEKHSLSPCHTSGRNAGKLLTLAERVGAAVTHLDGQLTKQQQTAVRAALTGKDSVISISRLNEYVHNPDVFPSKNDLIASWSGAEPFFRAVFK